MVTANKLSIMSVHISLRQAQDRLRLNVTFCASERHPELVEGCIMLFEYGKYII